MIDARLFVTAALCAGLLAGCADAKSNVVAAAGGNIPVASFDSVKLEGGGHVVLRYGAAQRVTLLKGSTQFTTFKIEDGRNLVIDACNSDCPAHYDLEIEIVTPNIHGVAISGGGHIESESGFPKMASISAAVEGGGRIDLRSLNADSGSAAVEGSGGIQINATAHLTAAVDGGGNIRYEGNPALVTAINGGGSVERDGS